MAGTTGLEPATSAVTGYAASISARSTSEQHWRFVSVHAGLRNARATLAHRCQLLHTHANASSSRSFVEKFVGKSESEDVEHCTYLRARPRKFGLAAILGFHALRQEQVPDCQRPGWGLAQP